MSYYYGKTDIPERFCNEDSKEPFRTCVSCEKDLNDKRYFVEKAFKKDPWAEKHQVIFEYALCEECAQKKNNELSEESKANIEKYFTERTAEMSVGKLLTMNEEVDHCMVSQSELSDCEEYVIYGYFEGDQMLQGMFPYGLSGKILDEITSLLSEQTLGEIDDFIGDHFSGPPEFRELLKDKKWVVV